MSVVFVLGFLSRVAPRWYFNGAAGVSGSGRWKAESMDVVAFLPAGSLGSLVAGTADLGVGRQAFASRKGAYCWDSSYCLVCFGELDSREDTLVCELEPGRRDNRACRSLDEVGYSEVRCRDVQAGNSRSVVASQSLDSFGVGHHQHPPPKGTLGFPASWISA